MNRRQFLTAAAAAAIATDIVRAQRGQGRGRGQAAPDVPPDPAVVARAHGTWCMYSRHLQWLSTQAETVSDPLGVGVKIGETAKQIGVAAVNLTVRNGGHVDPATADTCLPEMLKGIRSTGLVCDTMKPKIKPHADPQNTDWLTSQRVSEILALASAHGIKRYRIGGSGGYPANAYGPAITAHLDGWRVNMERLAEINKRYNTQAIYHTQGAIGMPLWDLMYVWRNIDPKYVGFNYCVGHVVQNSSATGATSMFVNNLRYIMPYLACITLQDFAWVSNADGTFSGRTPPSGKGQVNWQVFFKVVREGGYNGLFDTQEEYPITG